MAHEATLIIHALMSCRDVWLPNLVLMLQSLSLHELLLPPSAIIMKYSESQFPNPPSRHWTRGWCSGVRFSGRCTSSFDGS